MMTKPTDESLFDARVLQHRLRRGEINEKEYEAHLASLPDDAAEGKETETRFSTPYYDRNYGEGAESADESADD